MQAHTCRNSSYEMMRTTWDFLQQHPDTVAKCLRVSLKGAGGTILTILLAPTPSLPN